MAVAVLAVALARAAKMVADRLLRVAQSLQIARVGCAPRAYSRPPPKGIYKSPGVMVGQFPPKAN